MLLFLVLLLSAILWFSLLRCNLGPDGAAAFAVALRAYPGRLNILKGLNLRELDPDLPLHLRREANGDILNYYRDLRSGPTIISRRSRLMLLGKGGVGKTTLAQRLVAGSPPSDEAGVTHGIQHRACISLLRNVAVYSASTAILRHVFVVPRHLCQLLLSDLWHVHHAEAACIPADGPLEVSITDFGGQVLADNEYLKPSGSAHSNDDDCLPHLARCRRCTNKPTQSCSTIAPFTS